jgi:GLPGLI family protein
MKILSFVFLLLFFGFCASAQRDIRYGELTYWCVEGTQVGALKKKLVISFDMHQSIEWVVYVMSPNAKDTTTTGVKRETTVNEKGETINQVVSSSGPKVSRAVNYAPFLFKSLKEKRILSQQAFVDFGMEGKADRYIMEDSLPDFGWKITEERKKIAQFECIKAISKPFRGRVYEAWFTPEIPISDGPWKLCGLPGLILEAEDQEKELRFVMEKLTLNPTNNKTIENLLLQKKYPAITWEEYKKKKNENIEKMIKSNASKGFYMSNYRAYEIEKTR